VLAAWDSRDKMQILASMKDDPAKKIMVFFPDASPLGTEVVHQCGTIMKSADITQAIIVYRDQVTSHARSVRLRGHKTATWVSACLIA